MAKLSSRDPLVTATERDDDVSQLTHSLIHHYDDSDDEELLSAIDGPLRALLEDFAPIEGGQRARICRHTI